MNLGLQALMRRVEEVAREKGYNAARVLSKVNAHGEFVIALLIPPRTPGEWGSPTREQRRVSREAR